MRLFTKVFMRFFSVSIAIIAIASLIRVAHADGSRSASSASSSEVGSFEECARKQGKVLRTYPARCISQDGKQFIADRKMDQGGCKDLCGDGQCQQIVCMAVGCPCAETPANCSKDCD